MKNFVNLIFITASIFLGTSALASGGFKSKVDYLNPNGCRVFDAIVDERCPYDIASRTCAITEKAIEKIAEENPVLGLKGSCSRLHTGDPVKRALEEALRQSPSFDGFTASLKLNSLNRGSAMKIESSFVDAETCSHAANALQTFNQAGLTTSATCNGEKLTAQLQF